MVRQIINNMTYPSGRKLFVLGDSFAAQRPGTADAPTWHKLTADLLSKHHGEPVHLVNSSLIGSAQDFCWSLLQEWFANDAIGPDDYLVIFVGGKFVNCVGESLFTAGGFGLDDIMPTIKH